MERSESIAKLAMALAKAQAQMKGAVKDSQNPFFKSNYADLESVWDACRKPLTDNELSVIQIPAGGKDGLSLLTVLMHSSGEYISGELLLNPKAYDPQGIGSALTYGRRYALAAFAGVYQTDDDGEGAMNRESRSQPTTAPDGGPAIRCEDCGKAVIGYTGASGPITMGQAIAQSKDRFEGKIFCGGCQIKHGRETKKETNGKPKPEPKANKSTAFEPQEFAVENPEIADIDGEWHAAGTITQIFHMQPGKAFCFKMGRTMFSCWHFKTLVPRLKELQNHQVEVVYTTKDDFKNVERIVSIDGELLGDQLEIQEHETA